MYACVSVNRYIFKIIKTMVDKEEEEKPIEIISEQELELSQNTLNEFKKKNYGAALQYINKLDRPKDFKVAHNRAFLEYCKSDLKKNDTFQKNLASICKQFDIRIDKLDEVDHCIVHYNQAILLYHQRQYPQAIEIMDKVYKYIEPMDDVLTKQVSLFAIELQLAVKQPEKALNLISYVENQLINGTPNIKLLDKSLKERERKLPPPSDPLTEEFKKKLVKYKVRSYLMNHNLESAKRELEILSKDNKNVNNSMFLSANLKYLIGDFDEAIKILSGIPLDSFNYVEHGESAKVMFYNNMGIIHYAMGKPNLACHYFQTALKEDMAFNNIKDKNSIDEKPLHTLGASKYHEIVYNLGISLLQAGKAAQAFDCLIIAVRRYHRNSRLWMRLAECCIMTHKSSNEVDFDLQKKQKELIVDVVGSKDKQKVILTTNLSHDKKYISESQSYAVPVPSLEFSLLCLRNAFHLLPSETKSGPVPLFLIPGVTPPIPSTSDGNTPSSLLSSESLINLRNSILAASAYVSLCLGDYILALEYAKKLLDQPRISGVHKLLGHLYSAEALVLLNKIQDALKHLNPENVKDISMELPVDENLDENETILNTQPPTKWYPTNLASVHAVMQYNIAVAKTLRGQLDEAIALLKQVWQSSNKCKVPAHIIMLVIYIDLKLGHIEPAKNLIKQYLFHRKLK